MIIRKKYLFYVLAITSSFIAAAVTGVDSFVGGQSAFKNDPWAFAFALFFIGTVITLLISLALSIRVSGKSLGAKILDPSFKQLRMVQKSEMKYHLVAGLVNAINTVAYCAIVSTVQDPSVILSFSQIVILYLLLMESITEKDVPTLVEVQSSVIVAFGAILASISLTGEFQMIPILLVFVVVNPTWAIFSIYQRKLKILRVNNRPNDSINIRFWNVVFSCLFTALLLFIFDIFTSGGHLLAGITAAINPYYFLLLALTMGTTFFSYVLYIRSLGMGKASVNNAIRASTDPVMLVIKIIGMILIVMGIISFAFTVVKSYIFITVKSGYPLKETMNKLWDIRGVSHVTITSGKYDFIVKVSTRTLMKGYERIIKKIDEIDAIKKYHWVSVLKDWEKI
jgi:DNA-binding Lrp family transcriptional regulator